MPLFSPDHSRGFAHGAGCLWLAIAATLLLSSPTAQSETPSTPAVSRSARSTFSTKTSRVDERARLELLVQAGANQFPADSHIRHLLQLSEMDLLLHDEAAARAEAADAVRLARRFSASNLLVDALLATARAERAAGVKGLAVSQLQEALRLSDDNKYRAGQAGSLTELTGRLFSLDRPAEAVTAGEKALGICQELADLRCEARARYFLAAPYMVLNQESEAAQGLQRAAELWHELNEPYDQAETLLESNFLAIRLGQWQKAQALLNQARSLVIDPGAEPYIAGQIATSYGETYEAYGQWELALSYFQDAQQHYREAHDDSSAIDAGRLAGRVQARLGNYGEAAKEIEDGLQLARATHNRSMGGLCSEELGRVHLAAGVYAAARNDFEYGLGIYRQIGKQREAERTRAFLGQTYYQMGDLAAAESAYVQARKYFRQNQDFTNEAAIAFGLGRIKLDQGDLDQAEGYLKRSIALTEQLRENVSSKDLRSSFLASVHDRYETYVEWLMQKHARDPEGKFNQEAFEASELGRARSLLDTIGDYQREMRGSADPQLLEDEERLRDQEQKLLDQQAGVSVGNSAGIDGARVAKELADVRAQLESLQARMTEEAARVRTLLQITPMKFEELKNQVTDPETALFEYSLGARVSYLWVLSADGLHSYQLPPKDEIEAAARVVIEGLRPLPQVNTTQPELHAAIDKLSRMLLGPAAGRLPQTRLIVVADGILQYVPFAVLTDPDNEPLIAQRQVINAPSASALAAVQRDELNRPAHTRLVVAFGDPAMPPPAEPPDPTREQPGPGITPRSETDYKAPQLPELFYADRELEELGRLANGDITFYRRYDATRDNLIGLDLRPYRILHFATHGRLDSNDPERSGLFMSMADRSDRRINGFVSLADIYRLKAPADLVVLSACDTALGKDVSGEGLMGLTRGFMYAGASSVVASLWRADDEVSAEFMKRFYTDLLVEGMPIGAALRAAQNSIRNEPQWRAPYYWAGFILQGNYQQVIRPPAPAIPRSYARIIVGCLVLLLLVASGWLIRRRIRRAPKAA